LLGAWFGRSRSTDLYYFGWAFFQLVGSVLFAAYQDSAVVPILTEARLAGTRSLETITGSLLAHTAVVGGALSIGASTFAFAVVRISYGREDVELAARVIPIFGAFLVVLGFRSFLDAWLVVEQRFFVSPLGRGAGAAVMLGVVAALHDKLRGLPRDEFALTEVEDRYLPSFGARQPPTVGGTCLTARSPSNTRICPRSYSLNCTCAGTTTASTTNVRSGSSRCSFGKRSSRRWRRCRFAPLA
jgi:hypothetical protein